ncbi:MAG: NAD(P)-dependent oxidoreductase [Verrucomicrobiales bacterium]|nr:NAD(P)-dependent oxidoreductase [Verrucomicrobiales bacterium]
MILNTPGNVKELDELIASPSDEVIESIRKRDGDFTVLGAGGKMGYHLCLMLQKALAAAGKKSTVRAVSRFGSVRAGEEFEAIGCEVVRADLSDREGLKALPDSPNVFFLAGVKFGTSNDTGLLELMNVVMPRLVAERFRASDIVALSTGCVYSFVTPESGGSTERDETNPPGEYAISCLGREKAFVDAADRYGTRSALIRLNYSIDLRYGVLVDLAQKVIAGTPIDVTTGYVNLIWQGDAIRHTIRSLEHVSAPPFVINVTGDEILKVRDLARKFGDKFKREVDIVGSEAATAWLSDASQSHERFGRPEVSVDRMIDWVAEWLKSGGEQLGKPTHFETRDGKY